MQRPTEIQLAKGSLAFIIQHSPAFRNELAQKFSQHGLRRHQTFGQLIHQRKAACKAVEGFGLGVVVWQVARQRRNIVCQKANLIAERCIQQQIRLGLEHLDVLILAVANGLPHTKGFFQRMPS